jgi:hypothetical protein
LYLGKFGHGTRQFLINAFNEPDSALSPLSQLRDMFTAVKLINDGVIASANGVNLNFNTSAGILYGLGIGYVTNKLNPNSLTVSGQSPTTFQYRTQTGGTALNTTLIDPLHYDINGLKKTIIGTKATNQRIYLLQNGQIRVQYGQTVYNQLSAAVAALQNETFVTFPNFRDNGILIGILSVLSSCTDLTDTSKAQFFSVSKFGELIGAAGGTSTTTLQQAYNNSSQPEIVTNSAEGALSIKNGTGNVDNVTNLFEGINTAGNTTSFIRADGYISAATVQTGGVVLNSNGLTATTLSATTYLGLPISGSSSQVAYFNSNSGLTGSTNFLYSGGTLLVRAIGNTSASLPFVIRDSADSDNLFSVNGIGNLALRASSGTEPFTIHHSGTLQAKLEVASNAGLLRIYNAGVLRHDIDGRDYASFKGIKINAVGGGVNYLNIGTTSNARVNVDIAVDPIFDIFNASNLNVLRFDSRNGEGAIQVKTTGLPTTSIVDGFKQYSADIVAGNAAPHFRTENGNVVKLYTHSAVTTVQGVADALTTLGLLTASTITSGGIVGISDSFGLYTYYSTFNSAMSAATSGQTIEMFADVTETSAVTITLKNGVNINGNGHTYILNNSGGTNAFSTANSTTIECSIFNLNVIRSGSTAVQFTNNALSIGTSTSGNIYLDGSKFTNLGSGCAISIGASSTISIYNATANANTSFGSIYFESSSGAKAYNSIGISTSGAGINCYIGGDLYNCTGISSSGIGIDGGGATNAGSQYNCIGISTTNQGFTSGLISVNCIGRSTTNNGFFTNSSSKTYNCIGISVSGRGIQNTGGIMYNFQGISSSNVGILLQSTTSVAYNCFSKSDSSYSIWGWQGSSIFNSIIECNWNNSGGNGIQGISGFITSTIVNCVFRLSNTSAPYLNNGGTAQAITMRGNTYQGGGAFNTNLTQAITSTQDNQGNIYL